MLRASLLRSRARGETSRKTLYERYFHEQVEGTRTCFVATFDGQFAGYVTVNWQPTYAAFADLNIPEIQDLKVLTAYRRKGIASHLLDRAEAEVARLSGVVGIGVGLHPGLQRRPAALCEARLHPQMLAALHTEIALLKKAQA